jgi:hypothetical protein
LPAFQHLENYNPRLRSEKLFLRKIMAAILHFGQPREGFDVPVLDEREVRASAGILFLLALIAFMNSWLVGNFHYTRVFVVAFLVDFFVRVVINPKFAPTLILARFAVRRQEPEWTGAPQKRFAWGIGLTLAAVMFYLTVINEIVGPVNLFVCLFCLLLLFSNQPLVSVLAARFTNGPFAIARNTAPAVSARPNRCEPEKSVLARRQFLFSLSRLPSD